MSRHLMAKMVRSATSTDEVVNRVRDATGINLRMEDSGGGPGGGSYVLSGRLEDGSWVVASDHDGPCSHPELAQRAEHEKQNGPRGWYVGIYPNETYQHNGKTHDTWQIDDPIHVHVDEGASTHELPRVIQHALSTVPPTAKGDTLGDAKPDSTGFDYDGFFDNYDPRKEY